MSRRLSNKKTIPLFISVALVDFVRISSFISPFPGSISYEMKLYQDLGINRKIFSSRMNDVPAEETALNLKQLNELQWQLYNNYQIGEWKGVQTGYDPLDTSVIDHMYIEHSILPLIEENNKSKDNLQNMFDIRHTASIVAAEIRTDCEVCFDSERLKTREVGVYSLGKLRSRLCANAELRGPGTNQRGISTELCLRHEDGKIRALLFFVPTDFVEVSKSGIEPYFQAKSMILRDIVIVRERLNRRPLEIEGNFDDMWIARDSNILSQNMFSGKRFSISPQGKMIEKDIPLASWAPLLIESNNNDNENESHTSVNENKRSNSFARLFPGGIVLESSLSYGMNSICNIRLTWAPNNIANNNNNTKVYRAEIAFKMNGDVLSVDNRIFAKPPILTDYFVDELQMTQNNS
eukprot:gene14593-19594_t